MALKSDHLSAMGTGEHSPRFWFQPEEPSKLINNAPVPSVVISVPTEAAEFLNPPVSPLKPQMRVPKVEDPFFSSGRIHLGRGGGPRHRLLGCFVDINCLP